MSRSPEALLLDLDGTLIDSLPTLAAAMNDVLDSLGRPRITLSEGRGFMGHGLAYFVGGVLEATRAPGEAKSPPLEAALDHLRARYDVHCVEKVRPFDGIEDLLDTLAGRFRLAVCTNKPRAPTEAVLHRLGWSHRFETVVTASDVAVPKPDPALVHLALDRLDLGIPDAVLVGDTENDAGAAQASGIRFFAVSWGYAKGPVHGLGAEAVLHTPADLLDWV